MIDDYYDTSAGRSALQRTLGVAEAAGITVLVGLAGLVTTGGYDWEVFLDASIRPPLVAHNLELAQRVIDQVGDSASFGGFYIPQEMNLGDAAQCAAAGGYYAALIAGAEGRSGLRALAGDREIALAPYLAVGGRRPADVAATFRCLFDRLQAAGGIDRILVQDGVPKSADGFTSLATVGSYFQGMRAQLPAPSREVLWVDLETYAWPTAPCFLSRPATLDRISEQVRELGRHVGGFSQWIHGHNFVAAGLGADDCDATRAALGAAYVEQPFPFHGFVYEGHVVIRGYHLLPAGTGRVGCHTASGWSSYDFTVAAGTLSVTFAPDWVTDADVPDPAEVVEVSFAAPAECIGAMDVSFINPGGVNSAVLSDVL